VNTAYRLVGAAVLVLFVGIGFGQSEVLRPVQVTADQLTWIRDPRGYEQALVLGDPTKPGMYAAHIRFPANLRIEPHFHPDDRIVTVLSGTVLVGYGERFDESKMRALPAGSLWTEPARQPHFAWAKDGGVLLQVIGIGPSGTTPIPSGR
jgi:quercetin dioxygenase-like cupin family protein